MRLTGERTRCCQNAARAILRLVIVRPGLMLLLLLLLWLGGSTAGAAVDIHAVEIQIPGLSQPVRMAPADADAFQRRLNAPPPYAGPLPAGESYIVTSGYWDAALGSGAGAPVIDPAATYFPGGGIVRVRQPNRDAFFVLDLRQRALLDRYIRLFGEGVISARPGALDVLIAAAPDEPISIEVRGLPLTNQAADLIWQALDVQDAAVTVHEPPQPPGKTEGFWLTFTTAEGRALQYFYDPKAATLTDFLGAESYSVPRLQLVSSGETLQIGQQAPAGSKLWWPVMLGGGAALLGAGIWLRRRYV